MTKTTKMKVMHQGKWWPVIRMHEKAAVGEPGNHEFHVEGRDTPIPGHEVTAYDMGDGVPVTKAEGKTIPYSELIDEHEKLVDDLQSKDPKKLKAQATDQAKELKEYKEEAKKQERIEVSPDGKITRDVGAEPLDKQPQRSGVSKSLSERWDLIKAKVNADKAFMSMDDATAEDEDKDEEQAPPEGGGDSQPPPEMMQQIEQAAQQQQSGDQEQPQGQPDQEQPQGQPSPEELAQMMKEEGYSDSEIAHILHGHVPPIPTAEDHEAVNERMDGEQDRMLQQREADLKHSHMQRLHDIEAKRKEAELASVDPDMEKEHSRRLKDLEAKKKEAELASIDPELEKEHNRRLKDLEFEKAKRTLEAEDHEGEKDHKRKLRDMELSAKQSELEMKSAQEEKAHKRRMLELEYEKAKLEMELDIEFKKKEMALKLKQREEMIKQATAEKKEIAAIKHEQAREMAENPEEQTEIQPKKKTVNKDK